MGNHLGYEYDEDELKQGINLEIQKFEAFFKNDQYINIDIYYYRFFENCGISCIL